MGYTVLNAGAFKAQIAAQMDRVRKQAEARITFMVLRAQIYASSISPTYSGDFSENWNVSYGSPDTTFNDSGTGGDYYQESNGSMSFKPRDKWSGALGTFNMTGFKLGAPVFLSNAAAHDEPYAWKIENNAINFRPVNTDKGRVRAKTMNYLTSMLGV